MQFIYLSVFKMIWQGMTGVSFLPEKKHGKIGYPKTHKLHF